MEPAQIHKLLAGSQIVQLRNLGGRKHFRFFYADGSLWIISGPGRIYQVDDQLFSAVVARYEQLPSDKRSVAVEFNDRWPGCTDRILSPWIGRIVQFYDTGK
jgi:hypothetical protein